MTTSVPDSDGTRVRRATWMIIDQAVNSGFNLVIGLAAALAQSIETFGLFAILFASYLLVRGVFRALVLEPILIFHPSGADEGHRRAAMGLALLAGLSTFGVVSIVAVPFSDSVSAPIAGAFGLAVAVLLTSDVRRTLAIVARRPEQAAALSTAMFGSYVAITVLARDVADRLDIFLLLIAAAVVLPVLVVSRPDRPQLAPRRLATWMRQHRSAGGPLLIDFAASAALTQLSVYAVAVVSLAEAAAFRGAAMLAAPIHMLYVALSQFIVVEGARQRSTDPGVARATARRVGAVMLVGGGTYTLFLSLTSVMPELLLGDTAEASAPVVVPAAAMAVCSAFPSAGSATLRALDRTGQAVRIRLVTAVPQLIAILVGVLLDGARGVVIGGTVALAMTAPAWFPALGIGPRERLSPAAR